MSNIKPFPSLIKSSASIALASFVSIILYAAFDTRWWPRIGETESPRGWALGAIHILAIVQFYYVVKLQSMGHQRRK